MKAFSPALARRQTLSAIAVWAISGSSCVARPTEPPSAAPTPAATAPPMVVAPPLTPQRRDGRLPSVAIPLHYDLSLEIDPRNPHFFGTTKIDLEIAQPTFALFLHGDKLSLRSASIRVGSWQSYGRFFTRSDEDTRTEELVLAFPRELAKGPAELTIVYSAPFGTGPEGLFHVENASASYAFTQFEPCWARRAFPSFDEPSFKVPFDVAVTVPAGMLAFSNMPEASRTEKGREVQFKFATTPPLPTYLVALAVGDFDVDIGASAPVPIRLVRPKGKSADTRLPLELAHRLTASLSEMFAYPHPFPKIDLLAVPQFFQGAMENAGLIAFNEDLLLVERDKASADRRRAPPEVIAHELVHQWFGNLVTPRWWDDVWLSEGFATFFASRAIDAWRPSSGARLSRMWLVEKAMEEDAQPMSQPVHRAVVAPEEAEAALRGYGRIKAASLLEMLERFVGETAFREAIRRYLRDHAWKNATTDDFVSALENASGKELAAMVHSFLDKPGMPQLDVRANCKGSPTLGIEQEPFHLPGKADAGGVALWAIPFCGSAGPSSAPLCEAFFTRTIDLPLAGTPCPAFFDPNPGLAGYYRYRVSAELLDAAAPIAKDLGVDVKLGLLSNAWATVEQHRLQPDALLRFISALDQETDPHLVIAVVLMLRDIDGYFVDPQNERLFRRYAAARLAQHKSRLGLRGSKGAPNFGRHDPEENDLEVDARVYVAGTLGQIGDEDVLEATLRQTRQWVSHFTEEVDPDAGNTILTLGARRADAAMFDQLVAAIEQPPQSVRGLVLRAIGNVEDPALVRRALDLTLRPMLNGREVSDLLWRLAARRATRQQVYDWIAAQWPAIRKKWPNSAMQPVWQVIRFACSDQQRDTLDALFVPASAAREGWFGKNLDWYNEQLTEATHCRDLRSHGKAAVDRYLRAHAERSAH